MNWFATFTQLPHHSPARDDVRESEHRFKSLASAMPNHAWIANPAGDLEWFNSTVFDYFNCPASELAGDGWTKFVHPADIAAAAANWQAARDSGNPYETEFRLKRQDGVYRWFIARAAPVHDENGQITQWVGTNTDIQDQKSTEIALALSERRLLLSQKAAGIASFEVEIATNKLMAPDEFWKIWGLSPREHSDASVLENLVLPEDTEKRSTKVSRAEGTADAVVEYRIRRADNGEIRWVWRAVDYLFGPDGAPTRMFGVLLDVTERKSHQLSLEASEARYRGAMSVAKIGSWEADFVTGKRHWSPEAQELFGIDLPGGIGAIGGDNDEFATRLHPEDRHLVSRFHELARKGQSFDAEYRIMRRDGRLVWLSGRGQVFERTADGQCKRLINVVADVTERKIAEQHTQFLMQEITHRSKNLLAIIQGIARQTARRADSITHFQKLFGDRLQGLAASHDLLVRQQWQSIAFSDLVRSQLSPFAAADSQRLKISDAKLELNARAAQALGLALHELATNATKYGALSTPNGEVSVSWLQDVGATGDVEIVVQWIESGGPPVTPPAKSGFGSEVMNRIAPKTINGAATIEYHPDGIRYELRAPRAVLSAKSEQTAIDEF